MTKLESRWRRQHWIQFTVFISILLFATIALFVIDNLLLSFVVAVVCSYIVSPVISYLEGHGFSRIVAIIGVFVVFNVLLVLSIWALSPIVVKQLSALKESLPQYVDATVKVFNSATAMLNSNSGGVFHFDVSDQVKDWLTSKSTQIATSLPGFLSSSASVLVLSPLLVFFILKDGHSISRQILRVVPNSLFELTLSLQSQISDQIGQFIRARLLESAIVGAVVFIGLWIMGIPFSFLLAVIAGVANLIPYIGPIVGAVPGCVIAFADTGFGGQLILVGVVYALGQLIDMIFIIPLLVARIVDLHPVSVILSVILGAKILGVLGMLISIPVASSLKVILVNVYRHLTDDVV